MPEAADNTLGMAIMSAVVQSNGTAFSKAGVGSVAKPDTGSYFLDFVRPVTDCTPMVSATPSAYASWFITLDPPNRIEVNTYDAAGALTDKYFSIIVFCPQ